MLKGTHVSIETKKRMGEAMKRRWLNPEYRKKYHIARSGKNNPNYIDGRRSDPQYNSWTKNKWNRKRRGAKDEHTFKEWMKVLEKSGGVCTMCGKIAKLTQDHIIPLCLGGSNKIENIQAICFSCNSKKGKKLLVKKIK